MKLKPRVRSDRGSGQDAIPDTSSYAAAWLRLRPGQRRPRHTGATGLARPQEHPAHGALHRVGTASVQGLLALTLPAMRSWSMTGEFEVMGPAGGNGLGCYLGSCWPIAPPCRAARTHSKRRAWIVMIYRPPRRQAKTPAIRRTNIRLPHQSGLMLAARTTLPHPSVSSAMSLPKSAGEPTNAVPPRARRAAP